MSVSVFLFEQTSHTRETGAIERLLSSAGYVGTAIQSYATAEAIKEGVEQVLFADTPPEAVVIAADGTKLGQMSQTLALLGAAAFTDLRTFDEQLGGFTTEIGATKGIVLRLEFGIIAELRGPVKRFLQQPPSGSATASRATHTIAPIPEAVPPEEIPGAVAAPPTPIAAPTGRPTPQPISAPPIPPAVAPMPQPAPDIPIPEPIPDAEPEEPLTEAPLPPPEPEPYPDEEPNAEPADKFPQFQITEELPPLPRPKSLLREETPIAPASDIPVENLPHYEEIQSSINYFVLKETPVTVIIPAGLRFVQDTLSRFTDGNRIVLSIMDAHAAAKSETGVLRMARWFKRGENEGVCAAASYAGKAGSFENRLFVAVVGGSGYAKTGEFEDDPADTKENRASHALHEILSLVRAYEESKGLPNAWEKVKLFSRK
ncbi:MAG: hypothetical protein LBR73_08910 [Oscillospiraceae bacterium]|jgi:hypothetical protein|nr:hypothetical protein [Oscillospiraceae bacterium]